jgi:hypothetical protein
MSRRRDLVAKRHAAEVCAQQFGNDATSTALSNYIKGAAWINKNPQPPARSADPRWSCHYKPPVLGAVLWRWRRIGIGLWSESIQCLGKSAGAQLQAKTIP